ncbi:MAG TPA: CarD family transcriptional regulator [Anaerolineae bacterium]|nr:CarD family transcriptional regulator [Anaerolineae bacterium]
MEFRSGDDVVHPSYGVGSILRLEERQLAEAELRWYYVLAVGKHTVWMPVQSDEPPSLRSVTAQQELEQYRTLLKSRPAPLERDYTKRRLEISARLTQGSFRAVCEVVRDLTALGWYRRISEGDAAMLKKVRDNLWREWAVAARLPIPEAIQEIDALLLASREAYKS